MTNEQLDELKAISEALEAFKADMGRAPLWQLNQLKAVIDRVDLLCEVDE